MPGERTKRFSLPFPVADTEAGPCIVWDSFTLKASFTDYCGKLREFCFSELSHFEFVSEDELDSNLYQYDGAVEVLNSQIISRLIEIGEIPETDRQDYHHVVVGFNEIGSYLVVVFKSFTC
ncbi:MAG: hypothetical protein AAF085_02820 [Planctomycetota bacterium]